MVKKSTQVALGGLSAALCLLFMFMTGMIPFATYALPAMAGMVLIAVVVENGFKTAIIVYVAVSFLSIFIVPDREAALLFIAFFGYYPILKPKLDAIKLKVVAYLIKLIVFNLSVVGAYFVIIYLLGMPDILSDLGEFGEYSAYILLGIGNIIFFIYDFALKNIMQLYIHWFRVKFLGKIK